MAHFRYDIGIVYIKHILTHAEYDRLELLSILVEAYEDENTDLLPDASPQELVELMAAGRLVLT